MRNLRELSSFRNRNFHPAKAGIHNKIYIFSVDDFFYCVEDCKLYGEGRISQQSYRVNIHKLELDNNPQNFGLKPYGQRMNYLSIPNFNEIEGFIRFIYKTKNRRGRIVNRIKFITF